MSTEEKDEYLLDTIKGEAKKKKRLSILNKQKLTKAELDELMNE